MVVRRLVRDIAFAILIALPSAAFLQPHAAPPSSLVKGPTVETTDLATPTSTDRRISLLG